MSPLITCLVLLQVLAVAVIVPVTAKNYSVVLVGGHLADENEEIWGRIVELGGGVGAAKFGVVTAASEDPCCDQDSSWVYYRDLLMRYGAAEVLLQWGVCVLCMYMCECVSVCMCVCVCRVE